MKVKKYRFRGYDVYITKNKYGGWLSYIDITDYPEMQLQDCFCYDFLSFHKGCTFAMFTSQIEGKKFAKERFLIGCDWCHATPTMSGYSSFDPSEICEMATLEEVRDNVFQVVQELSHFRLKRIVQGNFSSEKSREQQNISFQ